MQTASHIPPELRPWLPAPPSAAPALRKRRLPNRLVAMSYLFNYLWRQWPSPGHFQQKRRDILRRIGAAMRQQKNRRRIFRNVAHRMLIADVFDEYSCTNSASLLTFPTGV